LLSDYLNTMLGKRKYQPQSQYQPQCVRQQLLTQSAPPVLTRKTNALPMRRIGSGSFGEVFIDPENPNMVLKKIPKEKLSWIAEIKNLSDVRKHPNIITLCHAKMDDTSIILRFPLKFPLAGNLVKLRAVDVSNGLKDIAGALSFAHSKGIIHRDIKMSNILVDRCSSDKSKIRLIVADWGMSQLAKNMTKLPNPTVTAPAYRAPEVQFCTDNKTFCKGGIWRVATGYGYGIDVYSFGILAINMLTNGAYIREIFQNLGVVTRSKSKLTKGQIALNCFDRKVCGKFAETAVQYRLIIEKCLSSVELRPTMATVCQLLDGVKTEVKSLIKRPKVSATAPTVIPEIKLVSDDEKRRVRFIRMVKDDNTELGYLRAWHVYRHNPDATWELFKNLYKKYAYNYPLSTYLACEGLTSDKNIHFTPAYYKEHLNITYDYVEIFRIIVNEIPNRHNDYK
jgi:serine/threonine protein kinase